MGELFSAFDTDSNGIVDMQELGSGLSLFCRGTSDDKITAAFKLFDLDGNGVITKTEMQKYLTSVYVGDAASVWGHGALMVLA